MENYYTRKNVLHYKTFYVEVNGALMSTKLQKYDTNVLNFGIKKLTQ